MEQADTIQRAIAFILDGFVTGGIMLAISIPLAILAVFVAPGAEGAALLVGGVQLITPLIVLGYFTYFEGKKGRTLGKKVMDLKVVKDTGGQISMTESLIRNVLRIIDVLPQFYIIGIVSIYLTEKSQRVGDLAAGTQVVEG